MSVEIREQVVKISGEVKKETETRLVKELKAEKGDKAASESGEGWEKVAQDIRKDLEHQIGGLRTEIREGLSKSVKEEVARAAGEVEKDLEKRLRSDAKAADRNGSHLDQESLKEMRQEIKNDLEKRITGELKDEIRASLAAEVAKSGDAAAKAVETNLASGMKKIVEEKLVVELRGHVHKVVDDIKGDVKKQMTIEVQKDARRSSAEVRSRRRLVLAVALSVASLGLGIGIAAMAGLMS